MKENINVLDEINKGACMGIDAISYIIDKVKDKKFKKLLERQSSEYKKISEDINEIYSKYNSDDEPHETNKMIVMLKYRSFSLMVLIWGYLRGEEY